MWILGLKGLTGFYCIELLCVTMMHMVCRDNDWKSLNVLLFLPIYHVLFFLRTSVFNWAVLLWGEVKCWSFSFSLFSGLLWNCTENNADYSRKTPASPNDWCKLTSHWWQSLFSSSTSWSFFYYHLIAFTMITILKKTREKKNIWTSHKNERRRCGTHNRARLQIKCALMENTQIPTM